MRTTPSEKRWFTAFAVLWLLFTLFVGFAGGASVWQGWAFAGLLAIAPAGILAELLTQRRGA